MGLMQSLQMIHLRSSADVVFPLDDRTDQTLRVNFSHDRAERLLLPSELHNAKIRWPSGSHVQTPDSQTCQCNDCLCCRPLAFQQYDERARTLDEAYNRTGPYCEPIPLPSHVQAIAAAEGKLRGAIASAYPLALSVAQALFTYRLAQPAGIGLRGLLCI